MNQTELLHMNFPHLRGLKPFDTAHSATPWLNSPDEKHTRKLCASVEEAVLRSGLQDGMTVSFHHAFREGDRVINTVVALLARMGFNGKSLINPRQIDLLHNAYAPTQQEVDHAKRVIEAAEEGERNGLGVVSLNGKMVDAPIINHAQMVLERAAASGVRR